MENLENLYNKFHLSSNIQKKTISDNNFTYYTILKRIRNILETTHVSKILDYGCGAGTLAFYLASKGYQVNGVDISSRAINLAKESANRMRLKNIKFTVVKSIDKEKASYDLVICTEVIEHVKNDSILLRKLFEVLKKGGYLYLSTPSYTAPLYKLGLLSKFDASVGHLRRYNVDKLATKLRNLGFEIENVSIEEGIIRNSLFTLNPLKKITRFIKGPMVNIVMFIDEVLIKLFGGSNIHIIAKKP